MLKCGIYESDITPALGMEMPGYFSLRHASGIKERLYAESVYFEDDNGGKVVVISCDSIQMPDEVCAPARKKIAEALSMEEGAVLICATHAHTAGPVETWGDFVHTNKTFLDFLESRMVDAAILAAAEAVEVVISYAKGIEDKLAYYRNYVEADGTLHTWGGATAKPFGEIDKEVGVLRIDRADGTPYGVIANYACHCDCVGGTEYSSDYPGEMRKTLRAVYGDDFRPVFINGFCGNINHSDPHGWNSEVRNHYRRMGRMLAADVIRTRELAVKPFEAPTVAGKLEYADFDARKATEPEIEWAGKMLADEKSAGVINTFKAQAILETRDRNVDSYSLPIQAVRIGELAIYGLPGEIYVEFGKMLKEQSPTPYSMPANLSNGCIGYVPIRELFNPGIYEASLGISSKLTPDGGYDMVAKALELAKEI